MSLEERTLLALSVEPPSARCGERVRIVFRTRNYGTAESPPGTVSFSLGAGLEPLGSTEVALRSVAPREEAVAELDARVCAAIPDRTEIPVGAALRTALARYRSNIDRLVVRSAPIFDGPESGTFVEAIDGELVRVGVVLVNEGDGPAQHVRVVVAPPMGTQIVSGEAVAEARRLDPGERLEAAIEARIIAPCGELCADAVRVTFAGGEVVAPVRARLRLGPHVSLAHASVNAERRTARLTLAVENAGWTAAEATRCAIALPSSVRAIPETSNVDGIPVTAGRARGRGEAIARLWRDQEGLALELGSIAPRSIAQVEVPLAFAGGTPGGEVVVRLGEQRFALPFAPQRVRELRARAEGGLRFAAPGEVVRASLRIANAGDVDEALTFAAGEGAVLAEPVTVRLRAGAEELVPIALRIDAGVPHAASVNVQLIGSDEAGERTRTTLPLVVRGVPEPAAAASETDEVPAPLEGALRSSECVTAGVPFGVGLVLEPRAAVDRLRLHVSEQQSLSFVRGSAELDGYALLDREARSDGEASPLSGEGLLLRDVPAGARIALTWKLVADAPAESDVVSVEAAATADGAERRFTAGPIAVRARDAFAQTPPALPYHVENYVALSSADVPAPLAGALPLAAAPLEPVPVHEPPEPAAQPLEMPSAAGPASSLDPARAREIAQRLSTLRAGGLVAHLFALPCFFPDAVQGSDLGRLGDALRDVFDRLYVKLRIPGFAVSSDDLEDAVSRGALLTMCREPGCEADRCDLERLERMPFGAPAALRALVALLPARWADAELDDAFARFAMRLDGVLARYEGVPLELFDEALALLEDRALDEARGALLAAIAPYLPLPETVC